jgi:hypothetical protein
MHTNHEPDDPEVLKTMGYDRRDIIVPAITKSTIWIFGFCIFCFIISVPIYNYLTTPGGFSKGLSSGWKSMTGQSREPDPVSRIRLDKDTPRLQDNVTTKIDIEEMRRTERERLGTPGWIDQNKGIVQVPIERAMEIVVERGVGTGSAVPAKTQGNTIVQNAVGPAPK